MTAKRFSLRRVRRRSTMSSGGRAGDTPSNVPSQWKFEPRCFGSGWAMTSQGCLHCEDNALLDAGGSPALSQEFYTGPNAPLKSATCRFFLIFGKGLLTSSSGRDYKPLTDEDGGASGADGRLRSGVSHETAGIVGVICWKAIVSLVDF